MTAQWISWWGFVVISIILLGFAALVLWKLYRDSDALTGLLSEPQAPNDPSPPKASLSRFQFLIFTFVIAGLYLLLCIEAGTLIEIPGNVLALLGISGGTYVVSKTVSSSERREEQATAAAAGKPSRTGRKTPPPGPNA
ncbi:MULTISPECIES: hypothetical protein [Bradyrhizobium]|uniref:hypothetical protein n=1 Tax=Bradyrhizobium TaxID=374 RepID=UPI001BAC89A9|nr:MULTISPECIES: hypothetical protein [Bradyrhizobium]MBR0708684.1 hypothetical protein [Bradyrhizobium liaoningense]MDA9402357.1 hypothetical protein [Bradyrhizobium sp. CCBAU 45389]